MAFTREQLPNFSEDQLRKAVLMPLFRAMGYRDVFHYHGGTLEQGKDLVMWKAGDFTGRVNYAVVAKKGDITGQTSGTGSAGDVSMQIRQCFGKPYLDPMDAQECHVARCLVVASGRITKEATNSIHSVLSRLEISSTTFIDGDQLWEMLEKHLPEKMARELIVEGHKRLQTKIPGHRVEVSTTGDKTSLRITHFDPAVPPALGLRFDPNELQGKNGEMGPLKMFIETGEPLQIDRHSIRYVTMPEVVQDFLDVEAGKIYSLKVENDHLKPQQVQLRRVCDDGEAATLSGIEFRCVQAGTKEITLSNEHQDTPWRLVGKFHRERQRLKLNFKVRLIDVNVMQALEWFRFQNAMSKPGKMTIYDLQTGIENTTLRGKPMMKSVTPRLMELLKMLAFIQAKTRVMIPFQTRITAQEDREITELFEIVKTGEANPIESITFTLDRTSVKDSPMNFASPGAFHLTTKENVIKMVCGVNVNIGPAKFLCDKIRMRPKDYKAFLKNIKSSAKGDIKMRMEGSPPEAPFRVQYPNWQLSVDQSL